MKNIWWAWAVKNSVCIICWVVLAIAFDMWWIAFFALLFMSSLKTESSKNYYRVCDKCGKHSPYANSHNKALDKAKKAGWIHYANEGKDYCPDCKNSSEVEE
jgi:hypothetical protein